MSVLAQDDVERLRNDLDALCEKYGVNVIGAVIIDDEDVHALCGYRGPDNEQPAIGLYVSIEHMVNKLLGIEPH